MTLGIRATATCKCRLGSSVDRFGVDFWFENDKGEEAKKILVYRPDKGVQIESMKARVVSALAESLAPDDGLTIGDISDLVSADGGEKVSYGATKVCLHRLIHDGAVSRCNRGSYYLSNPEFAAAVGVPTRPDWRKKGTKPSTVLSTLAVTLCPNNISDSERESLLGTGLGTTGVELGTKPFSPSLPSTLPSAQAEEVVPNLCPVLFPIKPNSDNELAGLGTKVTACGCPLPKPPRKIVPKYPGDPSKTNYGAYLDIPGDPYWEAYVRPMLEANDPRRLAEILRKATAKDPESGDGGFDPTQVFGIDDRPAPSPAGNAVVVVGDGDGGTQAVSTDGAAESFVADDSIMESPVAENLVKTTTLVKAEAPVKKINPWKEELTKEQRATLPVTDPRRMLTVAEMNSLTLEQRRRRFRFDPFAPAVDRQDLTREERVALPVTDPRRLLTTAEMDSLTLEQRRIRFGSDYVAVFGGDDCGPMFDESYREWEGVNMAVA